MKKIIITLIALLCLGVTDADAVKKNIKNRTTITAAAKSTSKGGKFTNYSIDSDSMVDYPYFDSSEEVNDWNPRKVKLSAKAEVEWPESLEGCSDISALQEYLLTKVLNASASDDVESAIRKYLSQDNEVIAGPFDPSFGIIIKPGEYGTNWADILVTEWAYNGSGTGAGEMSSEECLFFDKTTGSILMGEDIIKTSSPALLRIVNTAIKSTSSHYEKTDEVPTWVIPGKSALTFVFPKYSISYGADGNVKIKVPYTKLLPYLTPKFKAIMGLR